MTTQTLPSDRSFGFVFAVFFATLGTYSWWRNGDAYPFFFGLSLLIGAMAIFRAPLLAPFNRAWMKFGAMLHRVVSPVVLGIVFLGVIVPFGVVMRLAGRDVMRRKWDRNASSYWIPRDPPGPDSDSLPNQF